mmetsp:Transcript_27234/g.78212  ORF Transcript_27234/g.78212 Transcript_27234/m.78212 type:complete len:226 (-) Transcript_27234:895-1572(-)
MHHGVQHLPKVVVRHPNNHCTLYSWMLLQGSLHLCRVDVCSTNQNHVILPVTKMDVAILIKQAHVTYCFPASLVCLRLCTPVVVGDPPLVVPHPHLAHGPWRQHLLRVRVQDPELTIGWPAHQVEARDLWHVYPLVPSHASGSHSLRGAIALPDTLRPKPVAPSLLEPRRARGCHVEDRLQRADVVTQAYARGQVPDALHDRRHAVGESAAVVLDQSQHVLRVEL